MSESTFNTQAQITTVTDHEMFVISQVANALLQTGYDYLETGLCSPWKRGFGGANHDHGRYVEVDPDSPWAWLRFTIFQHTRAARVDQQVWDEWSSFTQEEQAVLEAYCELLNAAQSHISVSLVQHLGVVASSVLTHRSVISPSDAELLLEFVDTAATTVWHQVSSLLDGVLTPLEAAQQTAYEIAAVCASPADSDDPGMTLPVPAETLNSVPSSTTTHGGGTDGCHV